MKTALLLASSLFAASLFACAAPTEDPQDPEGIEETGEVSSKMIDQGGCTPSQLAMGGFDDGAGECISGGGGGGGGSGGGGGGGGGGSSGSTVTLCRAACTRAEATCESRCSVRVAACPATCAKTEARCNLNCE